MPVGKKLAVVLSVMATGTSAAFFFRKDASQANFRHEASDRDPFHKPVERRLAGGAAWTRQLGALPRPAIERPRAQRVQPALASIHEPNGRSDNNQPTYQKSFNPVGALLPPIDGAPPEDDPSPDNASDFGDSSIRRGADSHVVTDGDTLLKLAERYLGRADRYREILELNRDVLTNPDLLPIGLRLRIPTADLEPREAEPQAPAFPRQEDAEEAPLDLVPIGEHDDRKPP